MTRCVLLLVALAACKDKPEEKAAAPKAPAQDGAGAATGAAPPPREPAPPKPPPLPPAEPPATATAEDCKRVEDRAGETLRSYAAARGVPAAQVDAVAKDLLGAYVEACGKGDWPLAFVACIGSSPAQADSYQRCAMRLPYAVTKTWDARVDAAVTKAGGKPVERPTDTAGEGVPFEELCASFVAEMARLDRCVGGNQYTPRLEAVYWEGRNAAVGGLIPPDKQDALRAQCEAGAKVAAEDTARNCPAASTP